MEWISLENCIAYAGKLILYLADNPGKWVTEKYWEIHSRN